MNSSTANGLHEHLHETGQRLGLTVSREVNHSNLPTFFMWVNGVKIVQLIILGNMVKLWRENHGQVGMSETPNLRRFIDDYLGHQYEGGGLDFDLIEPDSLDWIDKAILALLNDYHFVIEKRKRRVY